MEIASKKFNNPCESNESKKIEEAGDKDELEKMDLFPQCLSNRFSSKKNHR